MASVEPLEEVDLLDPHFQAPPDGSEPLVEGSPVREAWLN